MKKFVFILLSLSVAVFAGNFQRKNDNTVTTGNYQEDSGYESRVDTVYIEKPVEYRYGRVYVRKHYSPDAERNRDARIYRKRTAPYHCTNPNYKERHIH